MEIETKSLYSILDPIKKNKAPRKSFREVLLSRALVRRDNAPLGIDQTSLAVEDETSAVAVKSLLLGRLFYISHPSISNLECSINLNIGVDKIFFDKMVDEILSLANFNPQQIVRQEKIFSLLFKEVAAMKLLNIILKDNVNHALYPIYLKWIEGSEWMSRF